MKMLEEGKLYLKDYYILNESKKNMESYLNDIFNRLEYLFSLKNAEINTDFYRWESWRNKSTDGTIQFYIKPIIDIPNMRKDKADIYIIVFDVRNTSELQNTNSVLITLETNKTNKALIQMFNKLNEDFDNSSLLKSITINLSLENSEADADNIMETINSIFSQTNNVVDKLIEIK